jgi:diadenosine tetraphosphate (Ap4A) HIT family hydrolase
MKYNKTLVKFNYPNSLLKEYKHWYLLIRPCQVTLGSLVLITKNNETSYSDISIDGFEELSEIVKEIELVLQSSFCFKKINYLMLMMEDPEVHYHIIPRYSEDKLFNGFFFKDNGWKGMPDFKDCNHAPKEVLVHLHEYLKKEFLKL